MSGRFVVAVLAINLFVQIFWGPWLFWIVVMKLLELLWASYKVPSRVPSRI